MRPRRQLGRTGKRREFPGPQPRKTRGPYCAPRSALSRGHHYILRQISRAVAISSCNCTGCSGWPLDRLRARRHVSPASAWSAGETTLKPGGRRAEPWRMADGGWLDRRWWLDIRVSARKSECGFEGASRCVAGTSPVPRRYPLELADNCARAGVQRGRCRPDTNSSVNRIRRP